MAPSFDELVESKFHTEDYPHDPNKGTTFTLSKDGADIFNRLYGDDFYAGMILRYEGDSTQSHVNVYLRYTRNGGEEKGIYIHREADLFERMDGDRSIHLRNSHHGVER